jgi:DNA-binding transcriptional LysR family regulator
MRHLRALIAVAEELNFTRAAERLHLTQQALSAQIRQLEERVGTKLVERDTRRVELTRAGTALYEQARPLLSNAQQAVEAARAADHGARRLTVGYIAALTHGVMAQTMQAFAERHPDVEVTIHFGEFLDPWGGLHDNTADVAILYGRFDTTGLELHHLFSVPRGVALAVDHPLAAKERVTLEEFLAEPLIAVPMIDPVCRAFWAGDRYRRGIPPRVGATVRNLDALIGAVGAGLGVTGTVQLAVDGLGAAVGVTFRPVEGLGPLDFFVGHRAGDEREPVLEFVETALDTRYVPPSAAPA